MPRTGDSIQTEETCGFQGPEGGSEGVRFLFEGMKLFLTWMAVADAQPRDDTRNH